MDPKLPLMPKATAVWLVDNTTLTFRQIADFCGMHELEVSGIADGEVAIGIKGFDPVQNTQLTAEEIARCEADPVARLRLLERNIAPTPKRRGPRYTPLSKRQERPSAIGWLVRYHPELENAQIAKLVGSTKPTIESIRNRTHWNSANIQPVDPVALGLCTQMALDAAVRKAAEKKARRQEPVPGREERLSLLSTGQSLDSPADPAGIGAHQPGGGGALDSDPLGTDPLGGDPRLRSPGAGDRRPEDLDPDALFNLPRTAPKEGDDEDGEDGAGT